MTARIEGAGRAPRWVTTFGPIAKSLLAARVPLGFNGLITIPGRTTGVPRTTPVAIIVDGSGRRWVWAPWGDVQWVRNLRVAGGATITFRGRAEAVIAIEQDRDQRLVYFRDILPPIAQRIPFGVSFIRIVDGTDLADPMAAADGRPVFELRTL